jgi:hypothetical protein
MVIRLSGSAACREWLVIRAKRRVLTFIKSLSARNLRDSMRNLEKSAGVF